MAPTGDQIAGDVLDSVDPHLTDPPLLRDHSQFKTYKTSRFEYPGLRVFFRQHPKADELPKSPGPLPLLVFVHGLGGSVAQFQTLLTSLADLAPCMALDLPGCGRSTFATKDWAAYTFEAMCELVETVVEDYRDAAAGQTVVFIGHSMGTAIAAYLANKHVKHATSLAEHVVGLAAICPPAGPLDENMTTWARRFFWLPPVLFDLWRAWDGRGRLHSASVSRFVGLGAGDDLRLMQYRFNQQSKTPVWRRIAYGLLATYKDGKPKGGMGGLEVWKGLEIPVHLFAAENDLQTPPAKAEAIAKIMRSDQADPPPEAGQQHHDVVVDTAAPIDAPKKPSNESSKDEPQRPGTEDDTLNAPTERKKQPSTPVTGPIAIPDQPRNPQKDVRITVLPAPATHACLYQPRSVRLLTGLISDFLLKRVTGRLSLGWQLQYLSREGKWDVKNLAKWQSVPPVSGAIGPDGAPIFRAMKTLREADDVHCPETFVENWGDEVRDVIDISKDQPVYDPHNLNRAGVFYHKFPTVSKVPPEAQEVEDFINLVGAVREGQKERAVKEGWDGGKDYLIGVHCHYGFNRTGYFIVCYLVEKCGFGVQEAIDLFAKARSDGIRHSHFLNKLYVRYNLGEVQGAR